VVTLDREIGVLEATATNIIGMVGVGPFLTIPFMISAIGGPHLVYAWGFGALLALCDGLVYAELGAALPGSGGPYVYLREAYRPLGLGRAAAFVFVFQVMLVAPLSIAGGAVGFADYLGFYWNMSPLQHNLVAACVCAAVTALLYRDIRSVGRLAVLMLIVVLATIGWVIGAGLATADWSQVFEVPSAARHVDAGLLRSIGAGGLLAMYNYGGYNNVCNIGGELRAPERTMPRAIVLSIIGVVLLYVAMSGAILGVVPWREAQQSRTIASLFIGRTVSDPGSARTAALAMTALILFVTASSLYAVVLGYSRVPYAAALDGQFFRVFGRLHPTGRFPHVSLLAIAAISMPFCFFSIGQLVNWLLLVQIVSQFIWQCAAVVLLRRYRPDVAKPFRMWLYPWPAIISLTLWLYILATAPPEGVLFAMAFFAAALGAYAVFARRTVETAGTGR
jgi:amino acid transporter